MSHEKFTETNMERELFCSLCQKLFRDPVILPCSHNVCFVCAESLIMYEEVRGKTTTENNQDNIVGNGFDNDNQGDRVAMVSCPVCEKSICIGSRDVYCFPRNKIMEKIITRSFGVSNIVCQMCDSATANSGTIACEQCEIIYCEQCCQTYHPKRGPLASHRLVSPSSIGKPKSDMMKCSDHREENISMYCGKCKSLVCYLCVDRGRHRKHDVKALGEMFKEQKIDLTESLKNVYEKEKELQHFIDQLNEQCVIIQENGLDFEASVVAQCDSLIRFIEQKKVELLHVVSAEMTKKIQNLKNQTKDCEEKAQKAKGLIEFSLEVLKEVDPSSFLLVSNSLIQRVISLSQDWYKEFSMEPSTSTDLNLTLDLAGIYQGLQEMNFYELKAPPAPEFLPDQCSISNDKMVLNWCPVQHGNPQGFVVELDDGCGGDYIEVYSGNKTRCIVSGLQFHSTYRARVRAYSSAGESQSSDVVYLGTPDVAWFTFDPDTAPPGVTFSNNNHTVNCLSSENRVVLGNIGFSKGVHYWEITVDKYSSNPDPAFGVARSDTEKKNILGKDRKAWSMYADASRSWFRHNNEHFDRHAAGIETGSVVGVLLNTGSCQVTFFLNDEQRGSILLEDNNEGMFYPAVSLNRNVQLSLQSGLELPDCSNA